MCIRDSHGVATPRIGPGCSMKNPNTIANPDQVAARALLAVTAGAPWKYGQIRYNCEHFANWALYGRWECRQSGHYSFANLGPKIKLDQECLCETCVRHSKDLSLIHI
eukprot:TRINITY_DN5498_c0_g1_i2.p2 TRINITY_DN5498_c0_g1~~TRINITY_DN5498_c0_g1_i2.p2  ORF type:complete len:108 (-),score=9.51 TRINITY_DN5498_c0_g1_i2:160-483(-)